MSRHALVQVVTGVVVVVFAVGIWLTGETVNPAWLRFFSAAVAVATIVLAVWDRWLWGLTLAQRIPRVPRDVRGTWKGTLTSLWIDPTTGKQPDPKPVFLIVRQSASHLTVVLLTNESSSRSSLASLSDDGATASLAYMYLNRPDTRVEHRSRMHNGSAFLTIAGRPATRLRGRYWTDRDSKGEMDFDQRRSRIVEDFREATTLFTEGSAS
jgi:hypothetical protein